MSAVLRPPRRLRAAAREAIYAALFARVEKLPRLVIASRKFRLWNKVSADDMPALFLVQGRQAGTALRGMPTRWTLEVELAVYVHAKTCGTEHPAQALNAIVDDLEDALGPDNGDGACTLGGLVSSVTFTGIESDQGALTDLAVAIVGLALVVA